MHLYSVLARATERWVRVRGVRIIQGISDCFEQKAEITARPKDRERRERARERD